MVVAVSIMGTELPVGLELAGVVSLDKSVGVAGATGTAEPDVLTLLSGRDVVSRSVGWGTGTGVDS